MKRLRKLLIGFGVTLLVILLIMLLIIAYLYFGSFPIRDTNIDNYLQGHGEFDIMAQSILPAKDEFSRAETVSYEYAITKKWSFRDFFQGALLELFYDASTYEQKKESLDATYTYYEDDAEHHPWYHIHSRRTGTPTFSINGYHFRVVDWSNYPEYDEKYIALVAYNSDKQSICYLFFNEAVTLTGMYIDDQIMHLPLRAPWKENSEN